ncbi:MAG: hypothetical protein SGILL_003313 [Bacillariaceae sp.]
MGKKRSRGEMHKGSGMVWTKVRHGDCIIGSNSDMPKLSLLLSLTLVAASRSSPVSAFIQQHQIIPRRRPVALHSSLTWDRAPAFPVPPKISIPQENPYPSVPSKDADDAFRDQQVNTTPIQENPSSVTLKQWKHRLITKEDHKHMHKITGGLFLLSSLGLTGFGIRDLVLNGWTETTSIRSTPFAVLLLVLVASSIAQASSSIRLACHHRKGQPAVRNTFLCNAAVAILGTVSALWSSPWYPSALNGDVSKAFYLIMDAIGLIGMGDNLFRLKALIASRQTNSRDRNDVDRMGSLQYWKDVFIYMMPILIGAPFFLCIGWQFGIRHDRQFYLDILQTGCHAHLQAGAVYSMIMVSMGASYSSLIVTLRDKKLIGKKTEGLCLTAVMLCLIGSLVQAMRDQGTIAALLGL